VDNCTAKGRKAAKTKIKGQIRGVCVCGYKCANRYNKKRVQIASVGNDMRHIGRGGAKGKEKPRRSVAGSLVVGYNVISLF